MSSSYKGQALKAYGGVQDTYLHNSSAIVGNGLPSVLIDHEQVTTVGA
jgi:hypothetical protein